VYFISISIEQISASFKISVPDLRLYFNFVLNLHRSITD